MKKTKLSLSIFLIFNVLILSCTNEYIEASTETNVLNAGTVLSLKKNLNSINKNELYIHELRHTKYCDSIE